MIEQLKILQLNVNKSRHATESALETAVNLKIDMVFIQEPYLIDSRSTPSFRSINHTSFSQILTAKDHARHPRVLIYKRRSLALEVNLREDIIDDPDLMVVDVVGLSHPLRIYNVYNQKQKGNQGQSTMERQMYGKSVIDSPSIVLGDFNSHHPWWDPYNPETPNSERLVEWLDSNKLTLKNNIGEGTFFRPNLRRESVLDLTFSTGDIQDKILDWQTLKDIGSDHYGILFTFKTSDSQQVVNPTYTERFNLNRADWDKFGIQFTALVGESQALSPANLARLKREATPTDILESNSSPTIEELDKVAEELSDVITQAANSTIPKLSSKLISKPWWNNDLTTLRKEYKTAKSHVMHLDLLSAKACQLARNKYFQAIKTAKREHWQEFLTNTDTRSIFKAMDYTKDKKVDVIPRLQSDSGVMANSFAEKCSTLRETLFPKPPEAPPPTWHDYAPKNRWEWPELDPKELEAACSGQIKGKTPGPDAINQDIIIAAYKACPDVFYRVFGLLFNSGYHPKCWRQAIGAILKKPGKPDYTVPKAYRVISLLNCLGKINERIVAKRLGFLAEKTSKLLHPSQIGGRLKKSAIDAALLLSNIVEENKLSNRITSTLFLDIKGAFDHVVKNRLLSLLKGKGLPVSLISWVASFLNDRRLSLSFNGQREDFRPIETGIPQGSPISPILFLIYISELFPSQAVIFLSYIDDISLTTSSTSVKRNTKILEREAKNLYDFGASMGITFDLSKTELIHFATTKKAKNCGLELPDFTLIQPKESVRWLGVYFDNKLKFKTHVNTLVSKARYALYRLNRLTTVSLGLGPHAMRQLYMACITSITDYGSQLWYKPEGVDSLLKPIQDIQNMALRKILGCFKTSPTRAVEIEAAIPPVKARLSGTVRKYALRASKLPKSHPISQELEKTLQATTFETRKTTQMERILNSVELTGRLEPITHHYFAPWAMSLPFHHRISQLPKEEAAKEHRELMQSRRGPKTTSIYTDASVITVGKGVGVGLAIFPNSNHQDYMTESRNIGNTNLVYNGELEGIAMAFEHASQSAARGQRYFVYADNQAAISRIASPSDDPGQSWQIRAIKAAETAAEKGASISLEWVPGHMGIFGNEIADCLAKEAVDDDTTGEYPTSFAVLGMEMKSMMRREWEDIAGKVYTKPVSSNSYFKSFAPKPCFKLRIPHGTPRKLASAFYQLKMGHGFFKSYLLRTKRVDSSRCWCGSPRETPRHLLLSCKEYKKQRKHLRESIGDELSFESLFRDLGAVKATLAFIKETGIATKQWHLEREGKNHET